MSLRRIRQCAPDVVVAPLHVPRVRQEDGGKKQEKGIVVQSWYPFGGRGWTAPILEYPEIVRIGRAH